MLVQTERYLNSLNNFEQLFELLCTRNINWTQSVRSAQRHAVKRRIANIGKSL